MKYPLLLGISVFAVFSIILSSPALAQEEEPLPDPGLTPDSPFYFLDDFWKSIRLSFTRNAERQVELRLEFAREKLAEMQAMAEEEKERALARATARYEEHLAEVEERLDKASLTDEQKARIEERLATAAERHQTALDKIEEQTAHRFEHIAEAQQKASEHQLKALRRLTEHQSDRAGELAAESLERRIDQIEELLESEDLTEEQRASLEEQLARLEEFREFGEEIAETVDEEEIRGLLQRHGQQAARTLERVLEQVPEEAQPAIREALERIRLHAAGIGTTTGTSTATSTNFRFPFERLRLRGDRGFEFCIQVVTRARNTRTGETRDFPTPCDVPHGWEKISVSGRDEFEDEPDEIEEIEEMMEDEMEEEMEEEMEMLRRERSRVPTPGFFLFNIFPFLEN